MKKAIRRTTNNKRPGLAKRRGVYSVTDKSSRKHGSVLYSRKPCYKISIDHGRQRVVRLPAGSIEDLQTFLTTSQIGSGGGGGGSDYTKTVIGILLADPRQPNVKEYLFNYLDIIDARSAEYFDLYIPGCRESNEEDDNKEAFYRFGTEKDGFVLDYSLFVKFIIDLEAKLNVKYTLNPMLVLVTAWYNHLSNTMEFKDETYVIQVDKVPGGIQRAGEMFDVVFDVAKNNSHDLDKYKTKVRMKYVKATAGKLIIDTLTTKGIIGKAFSLGKDVYELLPAKA